MVSAKKNLTVAALAALLAVPAFGATNASHALHIPSVAAHADESSNVSNPSWWYNTGTRANVVLNRSLVAKNVYQNPKGDYLNKVTGTTTFPTGDHVHVVSQGTNGVDLAISDQAHPINNNSLIVYSIPSSDATAFRSQSSRSPEMNNNPSTSQHTGTLSHMANQTNHDSSSTGPKSMNQGSDLSASTGSTPATSNNNVTNSNNDINNPTQYASKQDLPQTGESNVNTKAMDMAAAVALSASAGFMALSMDKKKRQEKEVDSVSSEPNIDAGDGKSNDDADDDYYHKIMDNTFASIREDFKKF